jgi:acyl-coenzyme A thioesterase PaaI-like protein
MRPRGDRRVRRVVPGLVGVLHSALMTDTIDDPRLEAAIALRKLNDAFVAHDADDELLRRISEFSRGAIGELRTGERRDRAALLAAHFAEVFGGVDGDESLPTPVNPMTDRAVGGTTNPISAEFDLEIVGDEVVVRTTLGTAYEGAPGRSHGGMVAALFDDFTAFVLPLAKTAAYTGELTVRYHRPVPVEAPLEFRARIVGHEGRKLRVTGECLAYGQVVASTEVLFITIDFQTFGQSLTSSEG